MADSGDSHDLVLVLNAGSSSLKFRVLELESEEPVLDGTVERVKITELLMTQALDRVPAESAGPGDIIAIAGIPEITIGETLADPDDPRLRRPRDHRQCGADRRAPMTPAIGPYDPAQVPELVALWNRALGGRLPLSERLWRQNAEDDPNWRPGDCLVARAADAPANFLHLLHLVEAELAWTREEFQTAAANFDAE